MACRASAAVLQAILTQLEADEDAMLLPGAKRPRRAWAGSGKAGCAALPPATGISPTTSTHRTPSPARRALAVQPRGF